MPLEIVRNDITRMQVDAIVNAANNSLLGGGGVDGAIHRAAGPQLLETCRTLGGCATGEAKITPGFCLPSRYVIHTVGPVWRGGAQGEHVLLASCYRNSLNLAKQHKCQSIAFPMISAGAYGFPSDQALRIAVNVISEFLVENEMQVYIVVFSRNSLLIGEKLFAGVRQYIDDHYVDERLETERDRRRRAYESCTAPAEYPKSCPAPMADMPESRIKTSWLWQRKQKPAPADAPYDKPESSLEEMLGNLDESFSQMLLRMIDERGMTDAACYKRANISRKLFSKIRSDVQYKPSKRTAVAFAVALRLSLEETKALLERAGFALSHSSKFDVIVEYFILHQNYDIFAINEALFSFDQPLLGG